MSEKLKQRIIKEMLMDEDQKLALEIFRELPSELQNPTNMALIMLIIKKIQHHKVKRNEENL